MSSVFKMSDPDERRVPPLIDPNEQSSNLDAIRTSLMREARSFDEIITFMSAETSMTVESKVTFDDFMRVVLNYCGN